MAPQPAPPASFAASLASKYSPLGGQGRKPSRTPSPAAATSESASDRKGGEEEEHLSDNLSTLGNSFIAFVGAGILNLPYAFSKAGYGLSTMVMAVVACICLHCMYLIVDCKLLLEQQGMVVKGYGDVGAAAFGRLGARLVDACLVITQFGFCTAYLIFISKNMYAVFTDSPSIPIYVWMCVPGLLVLATLRHLKILGYFSLLADFTNLFGLSAIYYYCFREFGTEGRKHFFADWGMLPNFFGVSVYCYEGVGMVIPIQSAMRNKHQFKLIWGLNMFLVTFLFWSFGISGYVAFGGSVHDTITLDLPRTALVTALVRVALCVGLYFTYPVMMFPVYDILEGSLFSARGYSANAEARKNFFRFCVVMLSALVAVLVPSFAVFISLVGSSAGALLAFILPAAFSLKLKGGSPLVYAREFSIIIVGVLGAILGTADALEQIAVLLAEG